LKNLLDKLYFSNMKKRKWYLCVIN